MNWIKENSLHLFFSSWENSKAVSGLLYCKGSTCRAALRSLHNSFRHFGPCILKCSICRWSRERTAGLQTHHCSGWKNVGRVGFFPKAFCFLLPVPRCFSVFSLNFSALSGSLTHRLLLLPLCLPPSCPSPPAVPFLLPPPQPHSLPQTLSSESGAVFSPVGCFLLFPHPHLLRRVAYQSPRCHDSKGSGGHSCPCHSGSHRDQVTERGCGPVLLIYMALKAALGVAHSCGLDFMESVWGQRDGWFDLRRALPDQEPGNFISVIISLDLLDAPWVLGAVLNDFILQALKSSFCLFSSGLKYCNTGLSCNKLLLFFLLLFTANHVLKIRN